MTRVTTAGVTKCGKCGALITSHGKTTKVCKSCWRVKPKFCATCGKGLPKYATGMQCIECWKARGAQPLRACVQCGQPMSRYTSPGYTVCKPCRIGAAPACVDCGKPMKRGTKSIHCWECYTGRRIKVAEKKHCTVPGCESPHAAKGLCALHYQRNRVTATRKGRRIDAGTRIWVAQQPCQICGYNRMRSEVHRPIRQGDYVKGNMIALCARCHREVTAGITPCPDPLPEVAHHSP